MSLSVRPCREEDLDAVVRILESTRDTYARFEPVLWKPRPDARDAAIAHFGTVISNERNVCLVAEYNGTVSGFLFATEIPTLPVYDSGPTAGIDEFHVQAGGDWGTLGAALIDAAKTKLNLLGYRQIVVVSGYKDTAKMVFLRQHGLSLASAWFTTAI